MTEDQGYEERLHAMREHVARKLVARFPPNKSRTMASEVYGLVLRERLNPNRLSSLRDGQTTPADSHYGSGVLDALSLVIESTSRDLHPGSARWQEAVHQLVGVTGEALDMVCGALLRDAFASEGEDGGEEASSEAG